MTYPAPPGAKRCDAGKCVPIPAPGVPHSASPRRDQLSGVTRTNVPRSLEQQSAVALCKARAGTRIRDVRTRFTRLRQPMACNAFARASWLGAIIRPFSWPRAFLKGMRSKGVSEPKFPYHGSTKPRFRFQNFFFPLVKTITTSNDDAPPISRFLMPPLCSPFDLHDLLLARIRRRPMSLRPHLLLLCRY